MQSSVPLTRGTPAAYAPAAPRVAVRSLRTLECIRNQLWVRRRLPVMEDTEFRASVIVPENICYGGQAERDQTRGVMNGAIVVNRILADGGSTSECAKDGRRMRNRRHQEFQPWRRVYASPAARVLRTHPPRRGLASTHA
jgi:hypothetical protein